MNFLDFIDKKQNNKNNVNEAFKDSDLGKAQKLILNLLRKETGIDAIASLGKFNMKIGENSCTSEVILCGSPKDKTRVIFSFNWLNSEKSKVIYSISFYKDLDIFFKGSGKAELVINTLGTSIVYFIPIIVNIIKTGNLKLSESDAIKIAKTVTKNNIKENSIYKISNYIIDESKYTIYEGISSNVIKRTFKYNIENNIFEDDDEYSKMIKWKNKKNSELQNAIDHKDDSTEDKERYEKLSKEYAEIKKAVINGAKSIDEIKLAVERSIGVKIELSEEENKISTEINKIKAEKTKMANKPDPEVIFKYMYKYIEQVAKGINNALIICGAPGVGKTWRTNKKLEELGYVEDVNLFTYKGAGSGYELYKSLYRFKDKGQILLIDDCDALVGKKAPEETINLLKAALDSTQKKEGRMISYQKNGKMFYTTDDGEEVIIPKKFYYNGGIIVLTNYQFKDLNDALKGRCTLQDIRFTTDDVLILIKRLIPEMEKDTLSLVAKEKAYNYLERLYKEKGDYELSIRTFGICAKLYESCMEDKVFSEEDIEYMISEQMKHQSE